ncbi:hypothetical protein [Chryseobacterium populi]|uniref:C1q domain containing protein n=1 Tax=Chryseobacterium populi TaxID=1144316 RepID=J3CLP3_9FLAO|nr:hypothetical protein [Chryseobacterium populi]EJL74036.1 hypothetical protein PMI13_01242 [Chryseobacterium populi]
MKTKTIILLLGVMMTMFNAQVVIGSTNVSQAAILKLDSNSKALRIPGLSITNRTNTVTPVASPAVGLFFYNTSSDAGNDIAKGIGYWGSDNRYHSQATFTATEEIISTSQIPLLVFSAAIGQKPITSLGSAAGGAFTKLTLSAAEIIIDKYSGWVTAANQYKIPASGIYMIEFITDMSNTGNNGGTTTQNILKGTANFASSYGRDNVINNRMYTTTISTQNLTVNDLLTFEYTYTANNYRIQSGTLNIYKYQ